MKQIYELRVRVTASDRNRPAKDRMVALATLGRHALLGLGRAVEIEIEQTLTPAEARPKRRRGKR